jgi:hypothetical protein
MMAETFSRAEALRRIPHLYDSAGDLQMQLEPALTDYSFVLTPGQLGAYNQILRDARALLPDSVALRDDAAEADMNARPADLFEALKTTIVPTLHNALPQKAYEER